MKIATWIWILLYPLFWCEVTADTVTSCKDSVSINCDDNYLIAVKSETQSIIPRQLLLEQCNARRECDVPLAHDQCVNVQYWCKLKIPTLEMETKKSSSPIMHVKNQQDRIGLMSDGYPKGEYQAAEHIHCNITFDEDSNQATREINFLVYDLASFTNFTNFCLSVKDSKLRPFCSGSQTSYVVYGPFTVKNKRQFSIKLASDEITTSQWPEVRFWFDILVSTEGTYLGHVECQSKPGLTQSTALTGLKEVKLSDSKGKTSNVIVIVSSVLGVFLLLAIVTLFIVAVFWCRHNRNKLNGAEKEDNNGYCYIDTKSLNSIQIWDRADNIAKTIPRTWGEAESVNEVPKDIREDGIDERMLPMKLELGNNDLVRSGSTRVCPVRRQQCQETHELADDEPKNTKIQASAEEDNDANADNECSSLDSVQVLNDVGANDAASGPGPLATQRNTIEVKDKQEVEESRSSQDDHDIEELSVVQQDTEATDAEIQDNTAQDSKDEDDDSIVNEYTSLNPVEPFGDGPRNHAAENTYTVLGNAACGYKIKGVMVGRYSAENPKKSGAECDAMDDSGEENDYLVLLPDDLLESEHSVQAEPLPVNAVGDEAVETLHEEDPKGDIADTV